MWPTPADTMGAKQRWSATNTWEQPDWTIDELVAAKDGRTVSLNSLANRDVVLGAYYSAAGAASRIEVRSPNVVTTTANRTAAGVS